MSLSKGLITGKTSRGLPGDYKPQGNATVSITGGVKATTPSSWADQRIVIAIAIPPRVLLPNQVTRNHWSVVAKARKAQREEVCWLVEEELGILCDGHFSTWPGASIEPHVFYRNKAHHADSDAICSSLKGAQDGVADSGLILDDKTAAMLPPIIGIDKENPRIELWITRKET